MKQLHTVFGITIFFYFFFKRTLSESKHALESEHSETDELLRDLSSELRFLDLNQMGSEEQEMSSPETQPSSKLGEKTDQMPQDELGRERREEKRLSDLSEQQEKEFQSNAEIPEKSLVSTSEDVLFQKEDRANVYPLVSECNMLFNFLQCFKAL